MLALEILLALFVAFFLQGLRRIPAEPPHAGIRTIAGKRDTTKPVVKEGWRFFPIYPYWHGVVMTNVKKVDFDLPEQKVRTPDFAELSIPVSITWTPDTDSANNLINFFNTGKHAGFESILDNIVSERLRIWANSVEQGPQTWKEAIRANEDASAILLKAILGEELDPIPSEIPTPILLKYFNVPRKKPTESETKNWGTNWSGVDEQLGRLSDEDREKIKQAIEKRREDIQAASAGNGKFRIPQFGTKINRLNIGEIKILGELGKAAEFAAREEREREAETIELQHIAARIAELKALNLSNEQAIEIIQTERGKVVKKISEGKLNISEETRQMFERLIPGMLAALRKQ